MATPEDRRARLNELGAKWGELSIDEIHEHDVLAIKVAEDEDDAARTENPDE
jgi:hypothetical protein